MVVDPAVSRAKFERELAKYRELESDHLARGWWLLRAEFPEIFVVFASSKLKPPAVLFGALLDFTDYDLFPPSVRLVDPFTCMPYKAQDLPTQLPRLVYAGPPGAQPEIQNLVQIEGEGIPFICIPGTREYHQHPAHSGDSWLLHRNSAEGTLHFILNQLYKHGVAQVVGYHANIQITVNGVRYELTPE